MTELETIKILMAHMDTLKASWGKVLSEIEISSKQNKAA